MVLISGERIKSYHSLDESIGWIRKSLTEKVKPFVEPDVHDFFDDVDGAFLGHSCPFRMVTCGERATRMEGTQERESLGRVLTCFCSLLVNGWVGFNSRFQASLLFHCREPGRGCVTLPSSTVVDALQP